MSQRHVGHTATGVLDHSAQRFCFRFWGSPEIAFTEGAQQPTSLRSTIKERSGAAYSISLCTCGYGAVCKGGAGMPNPGERLRFTFCIPPLPLVGLGEILVGHVGDDPCPLSYPVG